MLHLVLLRAAGPRFASSWPAATAWRSAPTRSDHLLPCVVLWSELATIAGSAAGHCAAAVAAVRLLRPGRRSVSLLKLRSPMCWAFLHRAHHQERQEPDRAVRQAARLRTQVQFDQFGCELDQLLDCRLILSGTPIQNNVLELWSLFDFLLPGYLGKEV